MAPSELMNGPGFDALAGEKGVSGGGSSAAAGSIVTVDSNSA